MRKNILLPFLLTALVSVYASVLQAQSVDLKTYYAKANNKKAAELKTALYGIITNHTNVGYDGLLDAYKTTDRRADGYLRDWYSNATNYVIGGPAENKSYKKEGDAYNREHTVPQSWFGNTSLMKSDLVQVVPTDGYINNMRSNHPLGENKGENFTSKNGYSKVGACTVSGYSGTCFEPNDEIKGDMARIYFYVLACYENAHPNWNGGTASQFFDGKKYPGLKDWAMKMLLRWAKQDPVDDVERARNEAVYKLQKNRNPFVDFPSLSEFVWGDSISYAFDVSLPHGQTNPENPDDPYNPDDPDNPDNPDDPDDPDEPILPGQIELSQLSWTSTRHADYGDGFTTSFNGLTISYYKAKSTVDPVNVNKYGELRFYDKSVLLISGAEVTKVTFHAGDKKNTIVIDGRSFSFSADGILTWEGSMSPFIAIADGQSRIKTIDITVKEPDGIGGVSATPSFRLIFDEQGRYLGHSLPPRPGMYLVRNGEKTRKVILK